MKKERESNLELLRVLCIICIISMHFVYQSGIAEYSTLFESFFYTSLTSLARVACSIFIIISAWFSIEQKFNVRRILTVWFTVIMYTIPLMLYCYCIGIADRNCVYTAFFPVERSPLWFAGYYIVLMLLAPILNIYINNASKKIQQYVLFVFFLLMVVYSTITCDLGFFSQDIWALIYIYLCTAYVKRHRLDIVNKKKILWVILFGFTWGILAILRTIAYYFENMGSVINVQLLMNYCETYTIRLQTLPNLIMAYSLFFLFQSIKIKTSKYINMFASVSLGVYCFHQVPIWYEYLWTFFYNEDCVIHGVKRMLYAVFCILMIWLMGSGVEWLRKNMFNILIDSRASYKRLCTAIDEYINEECFTTSFKYGYIILVGVTVWCLALRIYLLGGFDFVLSKVEVSAITPIQEHISMKLDLENMHYEGNTLIGELHIKNTGTTILAMSNDFMPINVGIILSDQDGNAIDFNYGRLNFDKDIFLHDENIIIPIYIDDVCEIMQNNYKLCFEVVQEGVSWIDSTAIYWQP